MISSSLGFSPGCTLCTQHQSPSHHLINSFTFTQQSSIYFKLLRLTALTQMLYEYFEMKGDFEDATNFANSHQIPQRTFIFFEVIKAVGGFGPKCRQFSRKLSSVMLCIVNTYRHTQTHTLSFVFTLSLVLSQQHVKLLQIIA